MRRPKAAARWIFGRSLVSEDSWCRVLRERALSFHGGLYAAVKLVESIIDEAYFLQTASLQIGQGLRHSLVIGESIHRDMHFRLG